MSPAQHGRTAPWAKALGAVLLTVLAIIVTSYAIGTHRANERKREAFNGTREDAQRFVKAALAHDGGLPATRQEMEKVYSATIGRSSVSLPGVKFDRTHTRVIAQFSRSYESFPHLLGPADSIISRCFTIDFPVEVTDMTQVHIIGHVSGESCAEVVAEEFVGRQ